MWQLFATTANLRPKSTKQTQCAYCVDNTRSRFERRYSLALTAMRSCLLDLPSMHAAFDVRMCNLTDAKSDRKGTPALTLRLAPACCHLLLLMLLTDAGVVSRQEATGCLLLLYLQGGPGLRMHQPDSEKGIGRGLLLAQAPECWAASRHQGLPDSDEKHSVHPD